MKSDLDQLIEQYEAEKSAFKQLLHNCLLQQDYLGAHQYSITVNLIETELQLLHSFKGNLHAEKQTLKQMIEGYEYNTQKMQLKHYAKALWENRIKDQKLKVEQLSEQNDKFLYDSQEIDDALFNLFEKNIKIFFLHLKEDNSLYFQFELSESNILNISIETKAVLNSNFTFYSDNKWSSFKRLGFNLNTEETALTFHYDMTGFKDATDIKILLARIVFNIYDRRSFDSAFIKVIS